MAYFFLKVLQEEWEKYLLSKVELRSFPTHQKKKSKPKELKGFGILDGVVPVTTAQNTVASSINKQENDSLLAAASEIRNQQLLLLLHLNKMGIIIIITIEINN